MKHYLLKKNCFTDAYLKQICQIPGNKCYFVNYQFFKNQPNLKLNDNFMIKTHVPVLLCTNTLCKYNIINNYQISAKNNKANSTIAHAILIS